MRYPSIANQAVYWTEVIGRVVALLVFCAACLVFAVAVAG